MTTAESYSCGAQGLEKKTIYQKYVGLQLLINLYPKRRWIGINAYNHRNRGLLKNILQTSESLDSDLLIARISHSPRIYHRIVVDIC